MDSANLETGSAQAVQKTKRRRLNGACDGCRKRKVKCDSSEMPGNQCTHCQAARIECTHDMPRQPTKAEMTALYIQYLEDRVARADKMQRLLQKVYPGEDINKILDMLPDDDALDNLEHKPETPLEKKLSSNLDLKYPIPQSIPSDLSAPISPPADPVDDPLEADDFAHVALAQHLSQLLICCTDDKFFGPSSTFMFIKHCADVRAEFTGSQFDGTKFRRPVFWYPQPWELEYVNVKVPQYMYPEEGLLQSLVTLYFDKVNSFIPLLHQPTFLQMLSSQYHHRDLSFGATVLMVCALGARHSQDPRVILPNDTSGLSIGWKYFCQVPIHRHSLLDQTSLYDLQYYVLANLYLLGTGLPHAARNILGLAVQSALERGAHRRTSTFQKPSKHAELTKRAFWCLVFIDRTTSAFVGRPCVIKDEDFDLDYPIQCDDEYWETEDPDQAFKQPPGKPSTITCFVYMLKLLEILAFTLRTLYSTKKSKVLSGLIDEEWQNRVVAQLDSSMNYWKDSLPHFLRWDPERADLLFFHQSAFLHMAYSYNQIQIHRPFLTKESSLSFPSMAICTNAARSCAHVLEVGLTRGLRVTPVLISSALSAGILISMNLWASKRAGIISEKEKEIKDLQTCLNALKVCEKSWHIGGRAYDLLNEVSFLVNDYQTTHNKRRRDSHTQATQSAAPHIQANDSFRGGFSTSEQIYDIPVNIPDISDWDLSNILLMQMPSNHSNLGAHELASANHPLPFVMPPTGAQNDASADTYSHNMLSDGQLGGLEYPCLTDDLSSLLWSDIQSAFSLDEWGVSLNNTENSV